MARRRVFALIEDVEVDELVGDEGGESHVAASGAKRTFVEALDRRGGLELEAKVEVVVSVLDRWGRVSILLVVVVLFDVDGPAAPGLLVSILWLLPNSRSELLFRRLASDEC